MSHPSPCWAIPNNNNKDGPSIETTFGCTELTVRAQLVRAHLEAAVAGVEKELTGRETEPWEIIYFGQRSSARQCRFHE
jgi:hypothetical protein